MFDHLGRFHERDFALASIAPVETKQSAFVAAPWALFAAGGGLQPWQAALLTWARQRAEWVAARPSRWSAAERIHSN